jgi:hypothetical protein
LVASEVGQGFGDDIDGSIGEIKRILFGLAIGMGWFWGRDEHIIIFQSIKSF